MAFLTIDDYSDQIKTEILTKIVGGDDSLRTRMERKVQEEVSTALRVRYDVPNIFNKTGDDRNQYLVIMMVDIVLFRLAKRLNPGQITETMKSSFDNSKADLDKIASGTFQIDLPKVGDSDGDGVDDKEVVQYGSMKARNPYY